MRFALRPVALAGAAAWIAAPSARAQSPFELTADAVRQGRFEARAIGRDTIVSTYPRAAREVHFKFALNGRDNEFPPGIEQVINLRPRGGRMLTPAYAFGIEPAARLPRPEDATEGDEGTAQVTIRADLRAVREEIRQRGAYVTPRGDTLRALTRVTVIGDTDPLVWDINAIPAGAPQDLTDGDGDGIWEVTLPFRAEYLRPTDAQGRAVWARARDLSAFPQLVSESPLMDAAWRLSLEELTQLVRDDGALSAGAKWPGVWTRDVSLSALLSLAAVVPDAVKSSLRRKVDARGRIIQDTGTGGSWPVSTDRMTWALAAWEVYAVTGDTAWLRESYDVIKRSAEADLHAALDRETGLFRGESSFEDWREQSYPRWMQPADIYRSFALGTNAVHQAAYGVLASMARALGRPAPEAARWDQVAARTRDGIAAEFWDPELQRHAQFLYGRVALSPSTRFEALGEALLAITGGAIADSAGAVSGFAPQMPFGTPTFHPFITGVPYYHNATTWPFVTAYTGWAAARSGNEQGAAAAIGALTRATALFLTNKENLVAETGHFEGTALNSDRQLWSVAGTLAIQYRILFGLRFTAESLFFEPTVPAAFAGARQLAGVRWRGATLTIAMRGQGSCVSWMTLDGTALQAAALPATMSGPHVVQLEVLPCDGRGSATRAAAAEGAGARGEAAGAAFAPETPVLTATPAGAAALSASLEWRAQPGAALYRLHANGEVFDSTRAVRGLTRFARSVRITDALVEWQLELVDSAGQGSFLSEPVRLVSAAGEQVIRGLAPARLERESPPIGTTIAVGAPGRYALDVLYSNGSGPVNTEDKAATRTLEVNGRARGVVVMPQRGSGNWTEQGWSNPVVLDLAAGTQWFAIRWDALDDNMNGRESSVIVHGVRLTRLADVAPVIAKVEPPDWWVGHSVNPVRLLVRGRALSGARVTCGALQCANVRVSDAGTSLFVDVTIPPATRPGQYPVTVSTSAGRASFDFTVHPPLARGGRFRGLGPEDVVYLIMPDRFANGDPSNDDPAEAPGLHDRADARYYHGGDLAGVRQKLPYLKSLGITAIWLTPVTDNVDSIAQRAPVNWAPRGYTDYHGYGATDLYAVEEHFGDLLEYQRLVDDAHALGMKVVIDHVANHTGPEHPWVNDPPTPTWFAGTPQWHLPNNWQMAMLADPYAATAVRDSTLRGWFAGILPDFDQDDLEVRRYLIQNTLWWTGTTGVDAIRQDTWPYVPRSFWQVWMAAIKREHPQMTVVGEVLSEDAALVSFFEGTKTAFDGVRTGIDQVFDFPLQAAARRAFLQGGSLREVAQTLARDRLYDHPERLVTVSTNHDLSRLLWEAPRGDDGLLLAYTFQFTMRGIPQVYYGDEIGMTGGGDPDQRRDFPGGWAEDPRNAFERAGRTEREERIFTHLQALIALRKARPELRDAPTEVLVATDSLLAYRRGRTVVVLNSADAVATLSLPGVTVAAIGGCGVEGGQVRVAARTGCIF